MSLFERLQDWYKLHCDGDWEHTYGIKIETMDNLGWYISVDLTGTLLEEVEFLPVLIGTSESKDEFWVDCKKEDEIFIGMGSADSLEKLISVFLDWADDNSDASAWDDEVNMLIQRCEKCNDADEFRTLYREIDSIPAEHIRKNEMIKIFNDKWSVLVKDIKE